MRLLTETATLLTGRPLDVRKPENPVGTVDVPAPAFGASTLVAPDASGAKAANTTLPARRAAARMAALPRCCSDVLPAPGNSTS